VNPVVDQLMARCGRRGGGTLLKLSGDVATVPTSLLQASLLPVLLAHLSDDFAAGSARELRGKVRRALVSVMAHPGRRRRALVVVRRPLLHSSSARGDGLAGRRADGAPPAVSPRGARPFGALLVLARAHVAVQNSRIMLTMGLLNAALNAGLNVALLPWLGLEGIASRRRAPTRSCPGLRRALSRAPPRRGIP